jgi:serine/threonine-protein kinase
MENSTLESHPGLLMSLVELTDGQGDTLCSNSGSPAEPDALWLSASGVDLNELWGELSEARPLAGVPALAGLPLRDYWPIAQHGRGSHGEVWKAVRVSPCLQLVALKVLRFDQAHRADRRDRFRREAELAMRLRGPGILPIEEFGEASGSLFMVMPFIDGATLADVIALRREQSCGSTAGTHLTPRPASWWAGLTNDEFAAAMVRTVARVARALALTHSQRLVHRDVKPANILLDRTAETGVFLADFGLGRDLDDDTPRPPDSSGTPLYMAPEKLLGQELDEVRCDIYSLGVTLFEAVTLYHPTPVPPGLHRSCLPTYLTGIEPPRPRELCPSLPPALEAVILKAIHRDPWLRYADAAALADDLERSVQHIDADTDAAETARRLRTPLGRFLRGHSAQAVASPHVYENPGRSRTAQAPRYVLYPNGLSNRGT